MTVHPTQKPRTDRQKKGDVIRYLGVASTVGINMVVSTFVGFTLGYWVLDRYLDSYPWCTLLLTALGIAAGFRYLFRIAKKANEKEDSSEQGV
jgi:F0F1-type ATP synthase assembly protein I